jgi:ABC-2 type transport system ATP-binding protein
LCPQELVIWETLTCLEQLVFVGTQYDLTPKEARRRSLDLLDLLALSEKQGRMARTLSGGMKRRLNLALALVHDPDLLILDEPQAGLDPQSRILVREFILSLAGKKTVILTTHEMDEADRLAQRVGIIDHGRLLVLDAPHRLKQEYAGGEILEIVAEGDTKRTRALLESLPGDITPLDSTPGTLRLTGDALHKELPHLFRSLEAAGVAVTDATVRKPTLEDVFISLTGRGLRE